MKIIIIGGGIGGLCAAVTLQKQGYEVLVYEAASTFKPVGAGIGIGSNAMQALVHMGVGKKIYENGNTLNLQVFQNEQGKTINKIDFSSIKKLYGQENITIQRAELHQTLLEALKPGTVTYNKRCIHTENKNMKVTAYFDDSTCMEADLLIAADGIQSSIRQQYIPNSLPRYSGYTCWRGIVENKERVSPHTSIEIWSTSGRFGYAPLKDGTIYWFACINAKERDIFYKHIERNEVGNLFKPFPDLIPTLIRETEQEKILHHDIYDIKPLKKFVFDRVILLGDAAHATTPNMGQGAGQAIEDALVLGNMLVQYKMVDEAMHHYELKRVARTSKVISLSRQIGWGAQLSNRPLAAARNFLFPLIPSKLLLLRLKFLFDIELK